MKSKVYFTKEITSESLVKIYESLNHELKGKVAVKVHSGEEGNQNYLRPEFVKNIIDRVGGTIVECNTAYDGARNTTEKHKKLITSHGWDKYYKVEIKHKRNIVSTGLGLSIVRNVLDKHKLKYGVISKSRKGTTFYVVFTKNKK